jgi:hypothetical protein
LIIKNSYENFYKRISSSTSSPNNFQYYLLDFKNPFKGDSVVAFIGIAASFCAVLYSFDF